MMIKRIFLYIAVMMSLAACSDDIIDSHLTELPDNGKLQVRMAVPQMESVKTRADYENDLNSVLVLIFASDDDNAQLVQKETITISDTKKFELTIDKDQRKNGSLYFVFVANAPEKLNNNMNEWTSTLKSLKDSQCGVDNGSAMVMSGSSGLQSLLAMEPVSMYRNAAKITAHMNDGNQTVPFCNYGFKSEGSAVAGAFDGLLAAPVTVPEDGHVWTPSKDVQYVIATKNQGTSPNPYIVVKAKYNGTDYYYRLDFQTNKNGELKVLNILPNYHYEFIIEDILGQGYNTVAEAAAHPTSAVIYDIHDHAPVIYNMISDGSHELGVSDKITQPTSTPGTQKLYVKVFSKNDEYADFNASNIIIDSEYSDWLSIGNIKEVTDDKFVGDDKGDTNNVGKVYEIDVNFKETRNQGNLNGVITVNWMGLSREVPVIWDRTFVAVQLFKSVTLKMYEGNTEKYINNDYFGDFLINKSVGTSKEQNNGLIRNEGFHFPLMYGNSGSLWRYEYVIEYADLNGGQPYSWTLEVKGDNNITVNQKSGTCTGSGPNVTLSRPADGDDYNGDAHLVINVTDEASETTVSYPVSIYHTGFFHQDDYNYATDKTKKADWTYYEVIKDDDGNRWLDRNLGATSSELYIEATDGSVYKGNSDAAGKYYRVAKYNRYDIPLIQENICPPGYAIPTSTQMDGLRKSSNFHTESAGDYYNSYYLDTHSGKVVYFPKARYLDSNNAKNGEARSGYYWTRSASSGLEKEEYGNWLKCLTISGNSTSYINGCVDNSTSDYNGTTKGIGYAMNVRCIQQKDDSKVTENDRTYFFVKGATHVFLYTGEGDQRTAVASWPGIAIGNYSTVDDFFNFIYESSTFTPDNLKVIFNYKAKSGQIITYSADPTDKKYSLCTIDRNPSDLVGWKVKGDNIPPHGKKSSLGGYWTIANSGITFVNYVYRVYWPTSLNCSGLNLYNDYMNFKVGNSVFNGTDGQAAINGGVYYKYNYEYSYIEFSFYQNIQFPLEWANVNNSSWGRIDYDKFIENEEGIYEVTIKSDRSIQSGNPNL